MRDVFGEKTIVVSGNGKGRQVTRPVFLRGSPWAKVLPPAGSPISTARMRRLRWDLVL